jgi:hypothetical protein
MAGRRQHLPIGEMTAAAIVRRGVENQNGHFKNRVVLLLPLRRIFHRRFQPQFLIVSGLCMIMNIGHVVRLCIFVEWILIPYVQSLTKLEERKIDSISASQARTFKANRLERRIFS